MKLMTGWLLFFASAALWAGDCDPAGSQMQMNQCALEDYEAADTQLNETWQALLDKAGDETNYVEKLRVAQRAWIAFRDAEVAAMFACEEDDMKLCWGSMYPLLYHGMMAEMTTQRTKQLQRFLKQGQNPAVGE